MVKSLGWVVVADTFKAYDFLYLYTSLSVMLSLSSKTGPEVAITGFLLVMTPAVGYSGSSVSSTFLMISFLISFLTSSSG